MSFTTPHGNERTPYSSYAGRRQTFFRKRSVFPTVRVLWTQCEGYMGIGSIFPDSRKKSNTRAYIDEKRDCIQKKNIAFRKKL
jgi:hypothetical protein